MWQLRYLTPRSSTPRTRGERYRNLLIYLLKRIMALNGGAPPRGSAAAAAANLRRRRTGGATGSSAAGGTAGNMLQFYTDDAPGLKISPNVVLVMSIGFIAFVAVLHVMGYGPVGVSTVLSRIVCGHHLYSGR
ncbi:unnamed protein product [Lactuca saligna]|uniref:Protein transport protein Sec61 subunit beta n=1 Tax=Lactuca saligna TaxID=75948 RepID=A0AA35YSH0_LACSI|nr:unnamed protein product [Lactuca saligna]